MFFPLRWNVGYKHIWLYVFTSLLITKNPKERRELSYYWKVVLSQLFGGQILNQNIVSVHGFCKEKVALSFMGNVQNNWNLLVLCCLFNGEDKFHPVVVAYSWPFTASTLGYFRYSLIG